MSTRFNHSPFVFDVWVDYNGCRFKDNYAIELHDGEVFPLARPNGGGWHIDKSTRIVEDAEVKRIKLLPDGMAGRFQMEGRMRLNRNLEYFGTRYPVYTPDGFIWQDEVAEGFRIETVNVIEWRQRKGYGPNGTTVSFNPKLIVTFGVLTDKPEHPEFKAALDYFDKIVKEGQAEQGDLYWWDQDQVIRDRLEFFQAVDRYITLKSFSEEELKAGYDLCERYGLTGTKRNSMLDMICTALKTYFENSSELANFKSDLAAYAKRGDGPSVINPNILDIKREGVLGYNYYAFDTYKRSQQ